MTVLTNLPRKLKAAIKKYEVPGASIAVLRNGKLIASEAAGVINLDTQVPATVDTVFQIGSITKPMTTTLVMGLIDEGKLELDAPVSRYLPSFRVADAAVSRQVTLRHLLSHQSGIDGDLFADSGRGDDSVEKLMLMSTMLPSLFPIGAKHSYCNIGFAVLGRVIEVVTGLSFDEALRQRLFEPLGMKHAVSVPEDTLRFRSAIGHVPSGRKKGLWYVTRQPYLAHGQKAAGSTPAMSVTDLLKFVAMHMSGGKNAWGQRVLSSRSVRLMQTRQITVQKQTSRNITHWGLGWFLMTWDNNVKLYGHDGAAMGQYSFLRVLPEKNLAIALLTNGGDATGLQQELFSELFAGLAKVQEREPIAPAPRQSVFSPEPFLGTYANLNQSVRIEKKRGGLVASVFINGNPDRVGPARKLVFADKQTLLVRNDDAVLDRIIFQFSEVVDNRFQFLADGMRQLKRIEPMVS